MNILDYVSKSHVKTATVEIDGQSLDFFYKELTGEESEIITDKIAGVFSMMQKQKENQNYTPDGDEIKSINAMRDYTLFYQLCDADGNRLFESCEEMKKRMPVKLLDAAQRGIQKAISQEDAEKNLKSRNGSAGYSDSQTDKIQASKTSLETTPPMN